MKTITLIIAVFLTVVFTRPIAADDRALVANININKPNSANSLHVLPFNGTLAGAESLQDFQPPTHFFVNGGATANTTRLGQLTEVYVLTVDNATNIGWGAYRFVAANGDTIFTVATAPGAPTSDPAVGSITEHHFITGGTGRFEGAWGIFTVHRLVHLAPDFLTDTTSGSFNGTIFLRH